MIYILFDETKDLSQSLIYSCSNCITVDIKKCAHDAQKIYSNEALYRLPKGMKVV
jgi:hypothetical protein